MNKIKQKIVQYVFERMFRFYQYPFDKADEKFQKLTDNEQYRYLQQVHEWVESKAYKSESQEIIRTIYQKMANESPNEIQTTGYRLTLLMMKKFDQRLLLLNEKYKTLDKQQQITESLN